MKGEENEKPEEGDVREKINKIYYNKIQTPALYVGSIRARLQRKLEHASEAASWHLTETTFWLRR